MTSLLHDPLLERLRAADPAARSAGLAVPERERIVAARRRRSTRRARHLGAVGTLTALTAALVLNLAPSGGPSGDGILTRAVNAAALPAHSIVVIESELTIRGSSDVSERSTTWLRTSPGGRIVSYRQLVTRASGSESPTPGSEETGVSDRYGPVRRYDAATGRVSVIHTVQALPATAFAVQVRRLLAAASASGRASVVRRDGYVAYISHAVESSGAVVGGGSLRAMHEVRLDPRTYVAFFERYSERWRGHGKPRFQANSERVISRRTLPDTPANRRFLALRGPTH